jgi:hypothetical protein
MMGKKRILSILVVVALVFSFFSNISLFSPLISFSKADPGNIPNDWDNTTTLNVSILQDQPRINWFDFQYNNSGTWESVIDQQIDVDNSREYRFIVNISSDQGWAEIEHINITAWTDLGDDSETDYDNHNATYPGGNTHLFLQYENETGTINWSMQWPDDEATFVEGDCNETVETDPDGSPGNTECYNVTFAFIPGYQFRYAPGDGAWDTTEGFNDANSWNFNITATDSNGNISYFNPVTNDSIGEFGVYSYSEITSVGWPTIAGNPGELIIANSNITVELRSNGNYSLSVELDELDHTIDPSEHIQNTTVSLRGGNLTTVTAFPGTGPLFIWGVSEPDYEWAQNDTTLHTTSDIEYRMAIPMFTAPGDYTGTLRYVLETET